MAHITKTQKKKKIRFENHKPTNNNLLFKSQDLLWKCREHSISSNDGAMYMGGGPKFRNFPIYIYNYFNVFKIYPTKIRVGPHKYN